MKEGTIAVPPIRDELMNLLWKEKDLVEIIFLKHGMKILASQTFN